MNAAEIKTKLSDSWVSMSIFPFPPKSKRQVTKAGKAIAARAATSDDLMLVEQWRAAHGYVINTFKTVFQHRISKVNSNAEFAQRLKRRRTVIDKLQRLNPDGTPLVSDVTRMHDFAGCRLIFDDINSLVEFRNYVHSPLSMANVDHKLKYDADKYNYIERPKATGYRGIHDVYLHHPKPHRKNDESSKPWHGLMVEVQYRTRVQHAWATALEISDIIDSERTKFEILETDRVRFFAIASEILARFHEEMERAFSGVSFQDLVSELHMLEDHLGILKRLDALRAFDDLGKIKKHNVLNMILNEEGDLGLEVLNFKSSNKAIQKSKELEDDPNSLNAVYVSAGNPSQLRSAYRNYFNDPVDFVKLLDQAMS